MNRQNAIVNGQRVAYWEANRQNAETVILIHGLGGDHRGLVNFSENLSGFRLILIDLPGWGLSEPLIEAHNVQNYVKFLELFRQKIGLRRFYLIGHSFGGAVALMYAKFYPQRIRKVVLINPVLENSKAVSWMIGRLYFKFAATLPDKICHYLLSNRMVVYITDRVVMVSAQKKYRKKILTEDYLNYRRASTRTIKESFMALDELTLADFIFNQSLDAFFLLGDKDKLQTPKYSARLSNYFKYSLVQFGDGGHLFPLEDPKSAGLITNHFLRMSK